MAASIRVLTLNICGLPSRLAPLADRTPGFARRIDESDVDIANFQEVFTRAALARLRAALPSFPYVAAGRGIGGPAGGLVTFSRQPIGAVSYRSFRGIVPPAGGLRFRAKRAVNSVLQGWVTVELAGLRLVNTHLTANKDGDWSAGNRYHPYQRAQLDRLHAALTRTAGAGLTVLTGDFNLASAGPLYPRIVGAGAWRDPFALTDPVTYHVEFLPPGATAHRIDYVLLRGDPGRYPVLEARTVFDGPVGPGGGAQRYLSDHVGLSVRIGLDCS